MFSSILSIMHTYGIKFAKLWDAKRRLNIFLQLFYLFSISISLRFYKVIFEVVVVIDSCSYIFIIFNHLTKLPGQHPLDLCEYCFLQVDFDWDSFEISHCKTSFSWKILQSQKIFLYLWLHIHIVFKHQFLPLIAKISVQKLAKTSNRCHFTGRISNGKIQLLKCRHLGPF